MLERRGIGVAPLMPANCGFDVAWSAHFSARHAGQPGFSGWMLTSDQTLNMLQNPIYDVRVKGCTP